MSPQPQIKPWYKRTWPRVPMAGLIFVVIANVPVFPVAKEYAMDLVSDNYYEDGKHIEIQLYRDKKAVKRQIQIQVLIGPDMNTAKVFVNGQFGARQPLNLLLAHPTRKIDDQAVKLRAVTIESQDDRMEYEVVFKPLHPTNHQYLCVEDTSGVWRVKNKWMASQGNTVNLTPMDKLFDNSK